VEQAVTTTGDKLSTEDRKRTHVFIGIPTTQNSVCNEIADLCEAALLMNYHPSAPWRFTVRRVNGKAGVEYARNCLVGEFLATDADVLWFIDQDCRPSANSFELLLLTEYDIAGGVYPAFQYRGPERIPSLTFGVYHRTATGWTVDPLPEHGNPILECDAVMMGATTIKRAVLEDPRMHLGPVEDAMAPPLFTTPREVNGHCLSTEDTEFCHRARDLGYRIGCHSGVKWGHMKYMNLLTVAKMLVNAYTIGTEEQRTAPLIEVAG
jgi:hypothetical protein